MADKPFIERVRDRIGSPDRRSDLTVRYSVRGGAPSESFEEQMDVSGTGTVDLRVSDEFDRKPVGETSGTLDEAELSDLLAAFEASLDDLVPRSEASFPPDATVGSITFEIDDEAETFYFDADAAYGQASLERGDATGAEEPTDAVPEAPFGHVVYRIDALERRLLGGADERP